MFSVEICENELLPVSIYRRDIAPGAYTVTTNSKVLYEEDTYLLLVEYCNRASLTFKVGRN